MNVTRTRAVDPEAQAVVARCVGLFRREERRE